MVRGLQATRYAVDEKLQHAQIRLFPGSTPVTAADMDASDDYDDDDDGSEEEEGEGSDEGESGNEESEDDGSDADEGESGSEDDDSGSEEDEDEDGAPCRPNVAHIPWLLEQVSLCGQLLVIQCSEIC